MKQQIGAREDTLVADRGEGHVHTGKMFGHMAAIATGKHEELLPSYDLRIIGSAAGRHGQRAHRERTAWSRLSLTSGSSLVPSCWGWPALLSCGKRKEVIRISST